MSLMGDALSHAILPGVALGYLVAGLSLSAMAIGGLLAGMFVAGFAGLISRVTPLKEDASLAAIYLIALALGVTLISRNASQIDLLHILFGSALGVDPKGLVLVAGMATISLLILAWMYRGMVLETFDPLFLITSRRQTSSRNSRRGHWESMAWHHGFQTLGTLMAVGLMMVPAVSSRMWHVSLVAQLLNASLQAMLASMAGLLLSYHFDTPSGPTIIGCAGVLYFLSLVIAPGGWLPRWRQPRHKLA
jgi:zinc/manganese transport system permease protein